MLAPRAATCQVCFDEAVVTPYRLSHGPLHVYVTLQAESMLYGVLAQLKCPICIRPTSLVRWRQRRGKTNPHLQQFETKVQSACDVACPRCHTYTSMLLPEMTCDSIQPLTLPTHLAQHVPELPTRCGQYRLSTDALYDYVRATFPGHDDVILSAILPLIHDVGEAFFLRWRRDAPFITSPCCQAALCFVCKVGVPKLHLVKGDGCDSMNCFCGTEFSWAILLRRHLPHLRWSIVQRHLPASEAYYRSHLAAATKASLPDTLAPWLGDNGIELATEVTNYACHCISAAMSNVAHLSPCLPPRTTYHLSDAAFLLDGNGTLRAVSLRYHVSQMDRWTPPVHAPLRTFLSTVLMMTDTIGDHSLIVVSLQQRDALNLAFVDARDCRPRVHIAL
ncbi:hypothetical protein SPRG_10119 [Saprolegnia parasitica CBS 223.65]|uniref:Uncharacterized protein n=1 Tax=Saprolegnia parasitica (strain CBS 223.65) TaxID=695850 RepID=A0A067C231_SAPPC|nr:hypothetical protein SPRG_10119 [Saprolegnia parasitica CBS 223.65]KDO24588.1 hypothetical protein SPRG_10119 [Saprolegnia parasitica CBS 223.65]|eukprot:XP_012204656.1 hypothetical protein SPRG_10119 [Saprolegnia parasitica CBS 223.65]